jgi:acyl carrier protein
MTDTRSVVLAALRRIAPEVDPATIRGDQALREQVDLDSMDFLNLLIDLNRELQVDVPESDYGRLTTLDGIVSYIEARVGGGATGTTSMNEA